MTADRLMLRALQESVEIKELGITKVFYLEADVKTREPFAVLTPITIGGKKEIGVKQSLVQLDIFHKDRYRAVEIADDIANLMFHRSFTLDSWYVTGLSAERVQAIKVEDGSWKVPVEIRFMCKEFFYG